MPKFDIIIVSYARAHLLQSLLASLVDEKPVSLNKVLILSLNNDSDTLRVIEKFRNYLPLESHQSAIKLTPGASRNKLLDFAEAEYLCFLDDDAVCAEGYFSRASNLMAQGLDVFGGPDQSLPNYNEKQTAMGEILADSFVMGPTSARHSKFKSSQAHASEAELTLCNMWIIRKIIVDLGLKFDEKLKRCEENLLLEQMRLQGVQFFYDPELIVFHLRRESLRKIAKIQFLSGFYRSVSWYILRPVFKPFFTIPLLTGFIISFPFLIPKSLLILLVVLHTVISLKVLMGSHATKVSAGIFIWSWAYIIIIHVFFSLGIFWGAILGWRKIENS